MYSEAGYGDIYFSILEKQLNFNVLSQPMLSIKRQENFPIRTESQQSTKDKSRFLVSILENSSSKYLHPSTDLFHQQQGQFSTIEFYAVMVLITNSNATRTSFFIPKTNMKSHTQITSF